MQDNTIRWLVHTGQDITSASAHSKRDCILLSWRMW